MTTATPTARKPARPDVVQGLLERTAPQGDCMVWAGARNDRPGKIGYGALQYEGRRVGAHRLMYEALHGVASLRRDQFVCHSCDNPPCINPQHLWLGDNSANLRDYVAKGLYVPRRAGAWKISLTQRVEIAGRYQRLSGRESNARALADEYGISHSRVRQIVAAARKLAA